MTRLYQQALNNFRNREMVPTSELVTTMLRASDYMKRLLDCVESSNEADVAPYVQELQRYLNGEQPAPIAQTAEPAATATPSQPVVESTTLVTSAPLTEVMREFLVECYENLDQMDQDLLAFEQDPSATNLIRNIFRTIHTIKGGAGFLGLANLEKLAHEAENLLGKLRDGERQMNPAISGALLATVDKCREGLQLMEKSGSTDSFDPQAVIQQLLAADCAEEDASKPTVVAQPAAVLPAAVQPTPMFAESASAASAAPFPVASADVAQTDKAQSAAGDSTIRVDVALLDKLMTRVGELVLARNQILQLISGLDDANFSGTAQRLNLITSELQEGVMKTRMQPIGNVWSKFPRVVRDLSSQLGKHVRIEMDGKETELDKTIVEAIKDPLTHLVRNSIDHGIESPEARRAAGKPEEGLLLLSAYHEGGQVIIEITDDGAGLNIERIRKKAVERGLVTPEAATRMSEREAAQLILLPGFSTAEVLTAVSGRGVGMDVVKTNIERIGGSLDVQSQSGQGTTVKIKIPLTLAIIPGLVVTCDGDRYAIPQVSLLELLRLEGEQARQKIEFIHGAPVYRLRGQLLPIVYLNNELELEPTEKAQADSILNIVVLRAEDRQFGLVVDTINDTEEIVVKPLSKQFKGNNTYAGATIMGDGKVALILDVVGIAQKARVVNEQRDHSRTDHATESTQQESNRQTMLLLSVGERQIAVPISKVARLEEIPRASIEQSDQSTVVQYRGEIMSLVWLSQLLNIPSQEDLTQPLQVVVYSEGGRSLGFVVDRIADIADAEITIGHECESEDLLSSAVIQQRVTDLLNMPSIIRRIEPKFFHDFAAHQQLAV